jgi:hypothetical protein
MNRTVRLLVISCGLAATALPFTPESDASTPWALIARRAIGRVEQMTQAPKGEQPGFDMASVVLNADPGKVYSTAVTLLHRNEAVRILAEDPSRRTVEFGDGKRTATLTVSELGTRLSQIVVGSATPPGQPSATPQVVEGILRVCHEMKVVCSTR